MPSEGPYTAVNENGAWLVIDTSRQAVPVGVNHPVLYTANTEEGAWTAARLMNRARASRGPEWDASAQDAYMAVVADRDALKATAQQLDAEWAKRDAECLALRGQVERLREVLGRAEYSLRVYTTTKDWMQGAADEIKRVLNERDEERHMKDESKDSCGEGPIPSAWARKWAAKIAKHLSANHIERSIDSDIMPAGETLLARLLDVTQIETARATAEGVKKGMEEWSRPGNQDQHKMTKDQRTGFALALGVVDKFIAAQTPAMNGEGGGK